ncbi:E3 ubiquitin-protein ligase XIAP-like [Xenopus laevis]|uniref:E3 ubiquitin-protein ligase XIAP n=1 Tax=Xenopus laevis TaxID=8355 RepID=A0A8J1LM13_XENLA|nr:E3 ubiquitin-protein ligase XIAP-like [Xenopus laevis]
MNTYNSRLETFSSWAFPVDKQTLANDGFYRIASFCSDKDATKCFYCGGVLNCWKAKDDPWEEHAEAYPGCKFLIEEKGQQFINHVQLKRPILHKANSAEASPALQKDLLKSPLVINAQQMGFPLEEIKKVMRQKLKPTGNNYTCVEEFVSDLCAQNETVAEKPKKMEISIEEKLRQLEEEKICKVCMDRRITIICIPCGHLVACAVCADVLDKCPICCTIIKRRQKIVMS